MDIWTEFIAYFIANLIFLAGIVVGFLLFGNASSKSSSDIIGIIVIGICTIGIIVTFFAIGMPMATEMVNSGDPFLTWIGINILAGNK